MPFREWQAIEPGDEFRRFFRIGQHVIPPEAALAAAISGRLAARDQEGKWIRVITISDLMQPSGVETRRADCIRGFSALRLRRTQSQSLSSSENSISLRVLLSKKSRLRANAQFAQVA
jgi:hypothetical protein